MVTKQQINITINSYDGELPLVSALSSLIERKYSEIFHSVIVHGSVATNEVIPYSDFDGLLIVKDNFATSKQLQKFKIDSMKLILKFDPLQHHGWFQILESQLREYPQHYLPYETLEYSKLIFPSNDTIELNLNIKEDNIDYKKSLKQLINSIEIQSTYNFKNERLYDFKSFLSKVMLLPTMYYSAKHHKGIFKKDSFVNVKGDFSEEEWRCIDIASRIRLKWNYNLSSLEKLVMTRPERIFRRITKKYVSPKIGEDTLIDLDAEFFKSLKLVIKKINKDIFVA